jgi:predicted enzyme related to lactoylglutathione lyase
MLKTAPFYATVPVLDLERARRFYEETLELGPASRVGPALSFACGRGTTGLMVLSPAAGKGSCAFWQVDDVGAVAAWLRGRGVQLDEVGETSAWFRDSEGNRMAVMLQPAAHAPKKRAATVEARAEPVKDEAAALEVAA